MMTRGILGWIAAVALATGIANAAPIVTNGLAGALIAQGGGAGSFSSIRALSAIVGSNAVQDELSRITARRGAQAAGRFVDIFDYAMADAWHRAGSENVSIPDGGLRGAQLGDALAAAGNASGAFAAQRFFAHILTAPLWKSVTTDIDTRYGPGAAARFTNETSMLFGDLFTNRAR